MPAPDDARLLPAINSSGAEAFAAQAARDAADAAPTATGGAFNLIPSGFHGLPPLSPVGAVTDATLPGAAATEPTIVVTPSQPAPPKVTVVANPGASPGAQRAPAATPPGAELTGLMASATAPADPNGDPVDQALAADATARAAPLPAKPGDMGASGAAATAAGQAGHDALVEGGKVDEANAKVEADARQKLADETAAKAAEQKQLRDQATAHVDELRQRAAKEPFHTLFEGKPGQMALAAFGILLGGSSYAQGHVNQSLGILDRAIKQDFDVQQAKHAQLWKDVDTAMQQGQALRSDQLQEMADFRARQAQTIDAVIAKGRESAASSKNKQGIAAWDVKEAQLSFERDKAYDEVTRLKQAQLETARHNRAEEGIQRTHAAAAMLGAKGKANADQEEKVYKLAARAFPSVDLAKKAVKESNDVHEAIDRLKTNPSSLTNALELGGIVKLIEGRNSIAGLKMAKDAAGNVSSGFMDELSKALTGNQGASRRQTLIHELETIATSKDQATANYRKQAETATSRLRKHAPEAMDAWVGGIFGEGRQAPALSGQDAAASAWAAANPNDPRAARIRARLGM